MGINYKLCGCRCHGKESKYVFWERRQSPNLCMTRTMIRAWMTELRKVVELESWILMKLKVVEQSQSASEESEFQLSYFSDILNSILLFRDWIGDLVLDQLICTLCLI